MRLGVKDPLGQVEIGCKLIVEEKQEVLKSLCNPKRLHLVSVMRDGGLDILDWCETCRSDTTRSVESAKYHHTPFPVLGIFGDAIEVEEGLHCLRTKQIERV